MVRHRIGIGAYSRDPARSTDWRTDGDGFPAADPDGVREADDRVGSTLDADRDPVPERRRYRLPALDRSPDVEHGRPPCGQGDRHGGLSRGIQQPHVAAKSLSQ